MLLSTVDKVSCCKTTPTQNIFPQEKKRVFIFSVDGAKRFFSVFMGKISVFSFSRMLRLDFVMLFFLKIKSSFSLFFRSRFLHQLSYSIFSSYFFIFEYHKYLRTLTRMAKRQKSDVLQSRQFLSLTLEFSLEKHSKFLRRSSSETRRKRSFGKKEFEQI